MGLASPNSLFSPSHTLPAYSARKSHSKTQKYRGHRGMSDFKKTCSGCHWRLGGPSFDQVGERRDSVLTQLCTSGVTGRQRRSAFEVGVGGAPFQEKSKVFDLGRL